MTNEEHAALIKVRDLLASGALDGQLNMDQAYLETDCGTTACIGGWMAHFMNNQDPHGYVEQNKEMKVLFYPQYEGGPAWDDITPAQAVLAIDNFLATGEPEWSTILT